MSEFCIIGSGISGSTIANLLNKKYSVILFDKARGPGGRASFKRIKGKTGFDHGTQYISPKTKEFKKFTKDLIKKRILKHYLIDTYNGKKLNLKSNGRCGGTSNLYFENGNTSFKDLLNSDSKSLYITETIGHGSNIVTGDYSVGATGFLVENGEFK